MPGQDLSRSALERVLARASELQSATTTDPGDQISEARLLEIAQEVGLDVQHVRQAIAEERALLPLMEPEHGAILDALGPSLLGAQRTVPGTPDDLLSRLEAVLPRQEMLTCVRRSSDRLMLEPRRDRLGNLLRSLGAGGRRFDLVRVDQLVISATAIDATRTVLRFDAVLENARRMDRTTAVALGAAYWLMAAGLAIPVLFLAVMVPQLTAAILGLLAIIAGAGSWLTWRGIRSRYRTMLARAQQRLEALLDEAQTGRLQAPESLLDKLLKS
jgi:hypothetical protein